MGGSANRPRDVDERDHAESVTVGTGHGTRLRSSGDGGVAGRNSREPAWMSPRARRRRQWAARFGPPVSLGPGWFRVVSLLGKEGPGRVAVSAEGGGGRPKGPPGQAGTGPLLTFGVGIRPWLLVVGKSSFFFFFGFGVGRGFA